MSNLRGEGEPGEYRRELRSEEGEPGEWPAAIAADLGDIVQLDPISGRRSISLRTRCAWSQDTGAFEPSWEFLDAKREPVAGIRAAIWRRSSSPTDLEQSCVRRWRRSTFRMPAS